jgi:CTP:molybdopterin cytidylyltransferase MocA/HD superfamily phosphohydrolase YqeK
MNKVTAIILCAGYSSRMNAFKPLMPLGEITALERAVRAFYTAGIEDIRVVAGYRASDILTRLKHLDVQWIINENYDKGMFSSAVAGIKTLGPDRDAFFILPADIPLVRPHTVKDLLNAFEKRKNHPCILYPSFQGTSGHPPLIDSAYIKELLCWNSEGGLRAFLAQYEDDAENVDVPDMCILLDMDTPSDYKKLLNKMERWEIPTAEESLILLTKTLSVKQQVIRHGQTVSRVAVALAEELNKKGCETDLELTAAAGLLHDLAREKPDHAAAGARILNQRGYGAVADIVRFHMDIAINEDGPITISEIVYLADKLVQGDRVLISLQERFQEKTARYADEPEIYAAIARRLDHALKIKQRWESVTGKTLEEFLPECQSSIL